MATWFLLAAALNLVAIWLFVAGVRAREDQPRRRVVLAAFGCSLSTLLAWAAYFVSALSEAARYISDADVPDAGGVFVSWSDLAVSFAVLPLPFAAWLGLVVVGRSRATPQ